MDRKTGGLCLRSSDLEQQTHQQNDLKQIPDFAESRFIHTFVKLKVIDVVRLVLFSVTGLRIGNIRRLSFSRESMVLGSHCHFIIGTLFSRITQYVTLSQDFLFYTNDVVFLIPFIGEIRHMLQHPKRMIDAVRYTNLSACKFDGRDLLAFIHDLDIVYPFEF